MIERSASSEVAADRLKRIARVLDDAPRLPSNWLELMRFLSGYYQRPLGETVIGALPPRLRALKPLPRDPARMFRRTASAPASIKAGPRQEVLAALGERPMFEDALLAAFGERRPGARTALRALQRAGWVEETTQDSGVRFVPGPDLVPDQQRALAEVEPSLGSFATFLLHGVTGSGKTEVYLHLIDRVVRQGGQALVLVPEIGLTPQVEARFRRAFPETRMVVLHSGLEDGARTAGWLAAARGEAAIILGTRLAVLTPLPRLALVVVDEEHDSSFKQNDGLRYSGRDAAIFRAHQFSCPVVLGTATPSLESWQGAQAGRCRLLELPRRAAPGAVLPEVRTVDLRRETAAQGFTPTLLEAIGQRLARQEQSLVFINRRGYAPVLACMACDWAAGCERCTARMVVHNVGNRLRCHHCGAEHVIPRACPTCGNVDLRALGRGTQRVESVLADLFPAARIVRIDRDSARRRAEFTRTLEAVRRGEADILVGTQMLAKGHDFPHLTLAGVLEADGGLLSTDYRAPERLFATLMQVAGRAGRRGERGEVLVQTRYPQHPLFRALTLHDFAGFAASLLEERRSAGFPPFVHEAVLRAEAKSLAEAVAFLRAAARMVETPEPVRLYDPVPNLIMRRAGFERAQLLAQSSSRAALQAFLGAWSAELFEHAPRNVRWHLDVDPIEND